MEEKKKKRVLSLSRKKKIKWSAYERNVKYSNTLKMATIRKARSRRDKWRREEALWFYRPSSRQLRMRPRSDDPQEVRLFGEVQRCYEKDTVN